MRVGVENALINGGARLDEQIDLDVRIKRSQNG